MRSCLTSKSAKRSIKAVAVGALLLMVAWSSVWAQTSPPKMLFPKVHTRDAPEVTPVDHGRTGQNFKIDWSMVADGPTAGVDALYLFTSFLRMRGAKVENTPVMTQLDLATGKLRPFYGAGQRQHKALSHRPTSRKWSGGMGAVWFWGPPVSGTRGSDGNLYLIAGILPDKKTSHCIRFDPRKGSFEEVVEEQGQIAAAVYSQGIWAISRNGHLLYMDEAGDKHDFGWIDKKADGVNGFIADAGGMLYAAIGPAPYRLYVLDFFVDDVVATRILKNLTITGVTFHSAQPTPWCELAAGTVKEKSSSEIYALNNGKAIRLQSPPARKASTYEYRTDFEVVPPIVSVRMAGEDWKHYPIVIEDAAWDNIKQLHGGPKGKYLYIAGWPIAWISRFDPDSGEIRHLGRDYVWYEMHNWKDEIWSCGYWGIKLLRWRPEEPWTFDYQKHYYEKTYPASSSPWGDKGVSNPRLVCKFRYLKQLHVRRPAGMTIGPDGRAYVGGRTPAVEYFDSRFGGAINWYDPDSETIGQIRDPFLHHSVMDICSAGGRYIAAVASAYICMYEPLPEDFSPGKFVLYDTKTGKVVVDISPLDAGLSYCEEGEPGRIVVAGGLPRKDQKDGVRGGMFIYDTNEMRVTHVIHTPFRVNHFEYNVLSFERGPDKKIYFYGRDEDGVALFRIDSLTGVVEPVLRGKNITDVAVYNNTGAMFTFFRDRVYFGCHRLVSLPVEAVTGER